jgi:hypothetical protein
MSSPELSVVTEASTWTPINLQEAVSGDYTGPQPALLRRSDGKDLMYPGKLHSVAGPPGGGKSWIAQVLTAQVLVAGFNVLYVDFEDAAESVVGRLKILGVPDQTILDRFGYVSPSEPLPPHRPDLLGQWLDVVDLVVLDGVTDAMTLNRWNPIDNRDAAEFIQRLVGPLASGARHPAVLMVDHVTKSRDNRGGYAIGAQHKLAAVQVQFTVETTTPFDQDHDGTITLSVTKDRYGQIQRLASVGDDKKVAQFHFRHPIPGSEAMTVYIDPPAGRQRSGGPDLDPTVLWKILHVIGTAAGDVITSQIKKLVTGRDATILQGIDHLQNLGLIEGFPSGRSIVWKLVRPIEGIAPATAGNLVDDPEPDWISTSEVALLLNPSDILPSWMSVPDTT